MGRWDFDDERSTGSGSAESVGARTTPSRHDDGPRIHPLPERGALRARDTDRTPREHALTLPSGPSRESVRDEARLYHLRGSEVDLLERVGRYRAIFTDDLQAATIDAARACADLASLEQQGLIKTRAVTRLRDGSVAEVVSVTHAGKALLDHHREQAQDVGQVYHAGWVKPAEVWHDASLSRMVHQAEQEVLREGEHVRRVVLDDELKARAYQALHEAGTDGLSADDAHRAVAEAQHLHVENGQFVFPDVRLEIADRDGVVRTEDLELVTEHYHRGQSWWEGGRRIPDVRRALGQPARRYAARSATGGPARPMTLEAETGRALEAFGYTTRQAQFLALVAMHGGYFLRRQFGAFTRRTHGLATVRFLSRAVTRGDVRSLPYGRQGQVFHVCARPLYAALGQEHNRNRRVAEWDAVTRKVMTLDFVLTYPEARFWATEEDKATLLRECGVRPALWPSRGYAPKRPGSHATTRYFVDKMPWYREAEDPRLWVTYVDADATPQGFETFLKQYRGVLGALPSGVTYVGATAWPGAVQRVFDKVIVGGEVQSHDLATFRDYCRLRPRIEAEEWAAINVADLQRYKALHRGFETATSDALYHRWRQMPDVTLGRADLDAARRHDCVLRVHALGDRYQLTRRTKRTRRGDR